MLAFYVQWHLQEVWRPPTFGDEDQEAKAVRGPVAPAQRSDAALRKVHERHLEDGAPAHSLQTLLSDLGGIVRNECRRRDAPLDEPTFQLTTTASGTQRRALELAATIAP